MTISAASDEACAVKSLRNLLEQFPKSHSHPLFSDSAGTLNRIYVTKKLQGIRILGYGGNYTGRSFRRAARLAGLSDQEIQLLGRWKSNSYSP